MVFWPSVAAGPIQRPQLSLQNLTATLRAHPTLPASREPLLAAPRSAPMVAAQATPKAKLAAPPAAEAASATMASPRASMTSLDGVDGDAMRGYRMALSRSALQHMRYPTLAQQQGWTGRTEVRIAVRGDGAHSDIALLLSSGYEALDREALETLRRAATSTPLPAQLQGREFTLDLPVIFELQD